jgi:hypothetical protein
MLDIFSDGQADHINHREQYAKAFPSIDFRDLLSVEYVRYASHTFTDLADQARIEEVVARWAEQMRERSEALSHSERVLSTS